MEEIHHLTLGDYMSIVLTLAFTECTFKVG